MQQREINAFARKIVKMAADEKLSVSDFQYVLNEAREVSLNSPVGLPDTSQNTESTGLTGIISAVQC